MHKLPSAGLVQKTADSKGPNLTGSRLVERLNCLLIKVMAGVGTESAQGRAGQIKQLVVTELLSLNNLFHRFCVHWFLH